MEVKIIAYILVGIFLGPVVSIAITPIFCLLRKIFFVPFIRENLRKEAIRKGHVIEASLQKSYNAAEPDTEFGNVGTMEDIGVYHYQYNGKTYKYRAITSKGLSSKITLYYIKNPRRATVACDLGNWETPWFRFYLIISLVSAIAIVIVGVTIG
ncbi:MAG: hypothetical protein J6K48_13045 [Lachnospiraceae bacterium]|nr:hypothetical protein [Lachnospiraceae bacterium]